MRQPLTETVTASEARQHFASLLNRIFREQTRVVVEKSGIPVAALVSTHDLERLIRLDREQAERFAFLDAMRSPFKDIPSEEIEREVDAALAEVRAEMRAERAVSPTP
jgi:prevent-host-death family protein